MSLYPTLEDLKIDGILNQQEKLEITSSSGVFIPQSRALAAHNSAQPIYENYLGCRLKYYYNEKGELIFSETVDSSDQPMTASVSTAITPAVPQITTNATGTIMQSKGAVTHGVRKVVLCKDAKGKVGIQLRHADKGVFVCFVAANSPAAMAGVKFGDQVLEIDGKYMAGLSGADAMRLIKNAGINDINISLRDRPFERNIQLLKDSTGRLGMVIKSGEVTAIVKDSSAARNGVLTNHQCTEIDGQNIIGLKDKLVSQLLDAAGERVTITVMPRSIYQNMIKQLGSAQLKREMDRSIPDV